MSKVTIAKKYCQKRETHGAAPPKSPYDFNKGAITPLHSSHPKLLLDLDRHAVLFVLDTMNDGWIEGQIAHLLGQ